MSSLVHLHVGVAKTGTTFLQRILFVNRELLAKNGVLYPGDRRASHFYASLDLRSASFQGHHYPAVPGAWSRLVDEVNGHSGTAVISHETLARTSPELIRQAVESFGAADVSVVVTARDLGRQLPAVWQERIKNRHEQSYGSFLDDVLAPRRVAEFTGAFWRAQWLPRTVRGWSDQLGPERVTLVTVPPRGSPSMELWHRFARAVDLPDLSYDFAIEGSNSSVGVVEAELLRRVNGDLTGLTWPEYEHRIKRRFAEHTLVQHGSSPPITLPPAVHDQVRQLSATMVDELRATGVVVIGDLNDLNPTLEDPPEANLEVREDDVLRLATRLVADFAAQPDPATSVAPPRAMTAKLRQRFAVGARWRRLRGRWRRG